MNPMTRVSRIRVSSPLLSGLMYALIGLGIATLLLSFMLKFTGMRESSLPAYVYLAHIASLVWGGIISGKRAGKRGWYYGGMTGIVYTLLIVLAGFLSYDAALTMKTLTLLVLSFSSGAMGGMIGVNMSK